MIQEIIVALIVVVAVAYIIRKYVYKPKNKNSVCGACGGCSGKEQKGSCH
ncbi:MAG: FeoB-associated Cys-rich membrane protein [Kingella sp. (in: b-proteobacteria)]|jgi:hypothetical protein